MKKLIAMLLALVMVLGLAACGASEPAAPAEEKPADVAVEETPAEPTEKKPEDYTGKLVIYSPHDPSPLEGGVAMFQKMYPNIDVTALSIPTGRHTEDSRPQQRYVR